MAFFEWEEKFSVLVPPMDAQHKKLVDIVNRFFEASKLPPNKERNGKLLNELIGYTLTHFAEEEKFMESIAFPGLNEHKMLHKALVARATEVKKEFDAGTGAIQQEVLNFLKSWLLTHIQGQDKKYGQHAASKKAS
jgi:hemerythrin-like metal-binding protein